MHADHGPWPSQIAEHVASVWIYTHAWRAYLVFSAAEHVHGSGLAGVATSSLAFGYTVLRHLLDVRVVAFPRVHELAPALGRTSRNSEVVISARNSSSSWGACCGRCRAVAICRVRLTSDGHAKTASKSHSCLYSYATVFKWTHKSTKVSNGTEACIWTLLSTKLTTGRVTTRMVRSHARII